MKLNLETQIFQNFWYLPPFFHEIMKVFVEKRTEKLKVATWGYRSIIFISYDIPRSPNIQSGRFKNKYL